MARGDPGAVSWKIIGLRVDFVRGHVSGRGTCSPSNGEYLGGEYGPWGNRPFQADRVREVPNHRLF